MRVQNDAAATALRAACARMDEAERVEESAWQSMTTSAGKSGNDFHVSQLAVVGHPVGLLRGRMRIAGHSDGHASTSSEPRPTLLDLAAIVENVGARRCWDDMFRDGTLIDYRVELAHAKGGAAARKSVDDTAATTNDRGGEHDTSATSITRDTRPAAVAHSRIVYTRMIGKWPTSPRDLFIVAASEWSADGNSYRFIATSIDEQHFVATIPPNSHAARLYAQHKATPNHVRAALQLAGWSVKRDVTDNSIMITYYALSDPRGWIPASVMALVKAQIPGCVPNVVRFWEERGAPPIVVRMERVGGDYGVDSADKNAKSGDNVCALRILSSAYNPDTGAWKLDYRLDEGCANLMIRLSVRLDMRRWAAGRSIDFQLTRNDEGKSVVNVTSSLSRHEVAGGVVVTWSHSISTNDSLSLMVTRGPARASASIVLQFSGSALVEHVLTPVATLLPITTAEIPLTTSPYNPSATSPTSTTASYPQSPSIVKPDLTQATFLPQAPAISQHAAAAHSALRAFLELSQSQQWSVIHRDPSAPATTYRFTGKEDTGGSGALSTPPIVKTERFIYGYAPEEVFATAVGCTGCREQWDATLGFHQATLVDDLGNGVGVYHAEFRRAVWPAQARGVLWVGMNKRMRSTFAVTEVTNSDSSDGGRVSPATVTHQLGTKIFSIATSINDDLLQPRPSTTRMIWHLCAWMFEPIYFNDPTANSVYSSSLHIPGTKVTLIAQMDARGGTLLNSLANDFTTTETPLMLEHVADYLESHGPPPSLRVPIDITNAADSTRVDWEMEERSPVVEVSSMEFDHATMDYRLRVRILRPPELFLMPLTLDDNPMVGGSVTVNGTYQADDGGESGTDTETDAETNVHYHLVDISIDLRRYSNVGYDITFDSPNCSLISALLSVRVSRAAVITIQPKTTPSVMTAEQLASDTQVRFGRARRLRHHIGVYMRPMKAVTGKMEAEALSATIFPIECEIAIKPHADAMEALARSTSLHVSPPTISPISLSPSSPIARNVSATPFAPSLEDSHDVAVSIHGQPIRVQSTGQIRFLRRAYQSGSVNTSISDLLSTGGVGNGSPLPGRSILGPKRVSFAIDKGDTSAMRGKASMDGVTRSSWSHVPSCETVIAVMIAVVSFSLGVWIRAWFE